LSFVDVIGAQDVQLTGGLDPLGEGRQAQVLTELDEGSYEGFRLGGMGDGAGERLVDLERVDRELSKIGQGGVTGAEVVNGDPDTQVFDGLEPLCDRIRIPHEGGLRDLDDQGRRVEAT
jgi:hypothetical protein